MYEVILQKILFSHWILLRNSRRNVKGHHSRSSRTNVCRSFSHRKLKEGRTESAVNALQAMHILPFKIMQLWIWRCYSSTCRSRFVLVNVIFICTHYRIFYNCGARWGWKATTGQLVKQLSAYKCFHNFFDLKYILHVISVLSAMGFYIGDISGKRWMCADPSTTRFFTTMNVPAFVASTYNIGSIERIIKRLA